MNWRLAGPSDLTRIGDDIAAAPRVALDTEFHAERRYLPQLYLVQIQLPGGETWVLDPLDAATLDMIAQSLGKPDWVVHGGQQDLRVLAPICGRPTRVLDTQVGAALVGARYPASYAEITARWLGRELDKGETLSDWSRRPLSPEQLAYAATDVADLLTLWDLLAAQADAAGRAAALESACREVADQALATQPPDWRRLAGNSALDPRSAAALDGLLGWRERMAALLDQPPRQVVPDPVLADLARRLPRTRAALHANRRLSKSLVRDFADDILAAIHSAIALPSQDLPRVIRPGSAEASRLAVLGAVADVLALRGGWGAGLVLPRAVQERLATEPPSGRQAVADVLGAWRDPLVGNTLSSYLSGDTVLYWDSGQPAVR